MSRHKHSRVRVKANNDRINSALTRHMREAHNLTLPRPELFLLPNDTIYASDTDEARVTYEQMESIGIANHPYSHIIIGVHGNIVFGMKVREVVVEENRYLLSFPRSDEEALRNYQDKGKKSKSVAENFKNVWEICGETMRSMPEGKDWELRFYYYEGKHYRTLLRNSSISGFMDMASFMSHDAKSSEVGEAVAAAMQIRLDAAAYALSRLLVVLLATRNAIKVRTKDKLLSLGIGKKKASNQKPLYTTTITLPRLATKGDNLPTGRTKAPHLRRGHVRNQAWGPKRSFHRPVWIEPMFVNADSTYTSTRVAYNTSIEGTV